LAEQADTARSRGSKRKKNSEQATKKVENEMDIAWEQEDTDSLLDRAIDIDQSIVGEAGLLQSDSPDSRTALGTRPDPKVDLEARKIEAKALKHAGIIDEVQKQLDKGRKSG
jgi:hypothetical protein